MGGGVHRQSYSRGPQKIAAYLTGTQDWQPLPRHPGPDNVAMNSQSTSMRSKKSLNDLV